MEGLWSPKLHWMNVVFAGGVSPWLLLAVQSMLSAVSTTTPVSMTWSVTTLRVTAGAPWLRWTHPEEEWDPWHWGWAFNKDQSVVTHVQCLLLTSLQHRLLCQSFVYAVGGNDGVASLSSVERFNPHLNKWTEVSEMGQRRAGNGVSKLNGCLYVVGKTDKSHQSIYLFSRDV